MLNGLINTGQLGTIGRSTYRRTALQLSGTNPNVANSFAVRAENGNVVISNGNLRLGSSGPLGFQTGGDIYMRGSLIMNQQDNYFTNMIYFNSYACIHAINGNGMGWGTTTAVNGFFSGTANGGFFWKKGLSYGWSNDNSVNGGIYGFISDSNYVVDLRLSTNAQTLRVFNTYTSSTSFETFVIDWRTTANTIRIGSEKGSAGGTGRDVQFVHGSDSGVWGGYGAASWAGIGSHIPGYRGSWVGNNGSTGFYATALGWNATASGDFSTAIGGFSYARYPGRTSLIAGQGPVHAQSCQSGIQTLTALTTDATATVLGTPTSGAVTHTACSLVTNSSITITGVVIAMKSDRSETASFQVFATWQNNAGTLTMLGSTITQLSNNADAWTLVASADNTNKRWVLTATGVAATSIRWTGTLVLSEITF